jgi:hypothetical protein
MLRLATSGGWWLVTHPDHAHLAGDFATRWGNALFAPPEPREHVLRGIFSHDDGWKARDAAAVITKDGKPAAFSTELVGTYSAFEDIDLGAYLGVRREAVRLMAQEDPYAAILISMHTRNLLSARADHSTIRPTDLPWLDAFLVEQQTLQRALREQLTEANAVPAEALTHEAFERNFRLLQACDNLSLLSCVDYGGQATLLWPQALASGGETEVRVARAGERTFRLSPCPFDDDHVSFKLRARFVPGTTFATSDELQQKLVAAAWEELEVTVLA